MSGALDPVRGKTFHAFAPNVNIVTAKRIDGGILPELIESLPEIGDVLGQENRTVRVR